MTRVGWARIGVVVLATVTCAPAPVIVDNSSASATGGSPDKSFACPSGGVTVRNGTELRSALDTATPGDVIRLADGVYPGAFTITRSGTRSKPIVLCGSRAAVLDGGSKVTYVLHLTGADWWRVVGLTIRAGLKGVMAEEADHNVLRGLLVTGVGSEAIHLRTFSSDNRIVGTTVRRTGRRQRPFGEGIYVGSARDHWCRYTDCRPDRSDHNAVVGNVISHTTAESIDVKEGTTGGVVLRNRLFGKGMTDADSWIEMKGNGWLVRGNSGRVSPRDGIQTYVVHEDWGRRNVLRANRLVVNGPGYGIYVDEDERSRNAVYCDNVVIGARKGFSNVRCRRP